MTLIILFFLIIAVLLFYLGFSISKYKTNRKKALVNSLIAVILMVALIIFKEVIDSGARGVQPDNLFQTLTFSIVPVNDSAFMAVGAILKDSFPARSDDRTVQNPFTAHPKFDSIDIVIEKSFGRSYFLANKNAGLEHEKNPPYFFRVGSDYLWRAISNLIVTRAFCGLNILNSQQHPLLSLDAVAIHSITILKSEISLALDKPGLPFDQVYHKMIVFKTIVPTGQFLPSTLHIQGSNHKTQWDQSFVLGLSAEPGRPSFSPKKKTLNIPAKDTAVSRPYPTIINTMPY